MHLYEAHHVMEALNTNDANTKLQEGWKLLTVVVTTHPNGQLHPCYVLGKSKADHDSQVATQEISPT
ncbi:hypothetical protein [Pseudomonas sp. RC10]|uniref:hypothetical protein n=1 Tax=Pseudomonas bambusae TaxID=3139142 RepID=UPI003138B7CA